MTRDFEGKIGADDPSNAKNPGGGGWREKEEACREI